MKTSEAYKKWRKEKRLAWDFYSGKKWPKDVKIEERKPLKINKIRPYKNAK